MKQKSIKEKWKKILKISEMKSWTFDIVQKIGQCLAKLCPKDQEIRYRNEEIREDANAIWRSSSTHIYIQPDCKNWKNWTNFRNNLVISNCTRATMQKLIQSCCVVHSCVMEIKFSSKLEVFKDTRRPTEHVENI